MKKISITLLILCGIIINSQAQNYIGKNWVQVQYLLAAKKGQNSQLFVEKLDYNAATNVYETINFSERTSSRLWTLISTMFNKSGICFAEIYTDFKSKEDALTFAKKLLPSLELVYSSSTDQGLMDRYIIRNTDRSFAPFSLQIGSTVSLPDDIMVQLSKPSLNN